MTLAPTGDLVEAAAREGAAVGAFNVILLEHAEALVAGAEQAGLPVILQLSENAVRYHGGLAPIAAGTLAVARRSGVPVAVQLDHAESVDLVEEALDLGLTSVMIDASTLPYDENVAVTARVVRRCHDAGVWVEAELGEIGGKDGVHAPGARTDPGEAKGFVAATGVDALAVAVGSSHAMTTRDATLDLALVDQLRTALDVPLVLHGSSGVPDATLAEAASRGMAKINIATHLNVVFTAEVRRVLAADERLVDPRRYVGPARVAVADEVARLLLLLRASEHGEGV